jgi:signal peptidase II
MNPTRSARAIALCVVVTVLFTALDLWTKAWAEARLSQPPAVAVKEVCTPDEMGRYKWARVRSETIVLVEGFLELRYAENCGAAFGLLDEAPRWVRIGVFMSAGALAVIALFVMFARGNGGPLFAWSVPLVVSGALGNMVDRVRLGYVVDFIHFHIHEGFFVPFLRGFEWPTFNIADSTITVGVALLLLDGLRQNQPAATKPAASAQAESGQSTRA